ncbi:mucin-13 [Gymnogyps californianus]|uniref:mucin-13 n=1 Tax=Gymnogyps californianus TaxID=33616 RepID=UPI0021C78693|nr:mucin-13 [Gymnogyps californianus]
MDVSDYTGITARESPKAGQGCLGLRLVSPTRVPHFPAQRKQCYNYYCHSYDGNPTNYRKRCYKYYCHSYNDKPNNYRKRCYKYYCHSYNNNPSNYSYDDNPTTTGNSCNPDPCGEKLAKCIALNSTFTCQCQYGFYYSNKDCHRGQIYPGVIILKGFYSNSVQSVNSMEYEEVFQKITTFFKDAFQGIAAFGQTVIVEIQPLRESRASLSTSVTVTNLFMENSAVDNKTVTSAINNAIKKSPDVSQYRATSYCAVFNCDAQTTYCEENVFPKCICKSNFVKTEWDDRSCSDCSKDCSAEENKYCAKENGAPTCKCMPNFKNKNGKCVSCPVGYSGENCKNNSELILIIVGTVFGAIILSLVIAVSIVSVRAKHNQDPEKKSLMKSRYSSPNTSDDRQTTMFPRVQTSSGHANPGYQPNNPYEMCSANRGRFPERDYVDLYEISREPEGFRMQKRY